MRIAFWGDYHSFDYNNIGGTDSIARRLGERLINCGIEVDFIHFNCPAKKIKKTPLGITLFYFLKFSEALNSIAGNYDHIVTFHVPPSQRLAWILFRQKESCRTIFHLFYFGWPESSLKRTLGFVEARIAAYNGITFCISKRIFTHVSKWNSQSVLLLPPVPENYFIEEKAKPDNKKLRLTYIGRIDPGKGTGVAFELFKYISRQCSEFEVKICGYHWKHKQDSILLHKKLNSQNAILYEQTDFNQHSTEADNKVRKTLSETDVLLLPYDKLSSTIDTPLLLLEAMAHLCVIVTRPIGDMKYIYGSDRSMLDDLTEHAIILDKLRNLKKRINDEKKRIFDQNKQLGFNVNQIADTFLKSIGVF